MQSHRNGGSRQVAIDHLENRRLMAAGWYVIHTEVVQEPITIGGPGGLKTISFIASNGRKTTFSVTNATATITFAAPTTTLKVYQGLASFATDAPQTVSSIVIANAIPGKASLKELGTFSINPGLFDVPSIVGGNLGSLSLPDVNLTGSLTLGSVKNLVLGTVSGATLSLGSIASKVQVGGVLSGNVTTGTIGALSAGSISHASIIASAPFSKSKLEIASIDGGSGILDSTIKSTGSIGAIKAGYIDGSVITAGVNAPAVPPGQFPTAGLPTSSLDIVAAASIKSVKISSKLITTPAYFADSIIAADSMGTVQLGQIDGGGGVSAESISSFGAMGPSGALDRFPFRLNAGQLKTGPKVQTALANLDIPYAVPPGLPMDTVFYNFNLDVLS